MSRASLSEGCSQYKVSENVALKVQAKVAGKRDIQVIEMLKGTKAQQQQLAVSGLMALAYAAEGGTGSFLGSPASRIAWDFQKNVAKYGDKAYPLSEAQIRIVVQEALGWAQAYDPNVDA